MKRHAFILTFFFLCLASPLCRGAGGDKTPPTHVYPPDDNSSRIRPRETYSVLSQSIDPQGDSIAFAGMRARMEEIRKTRPTVALVLSGGGAKGAAHIGVIRRLEELEIPIDAVLGTSMGGLVGGIYALGYSSAELDSLIRGLDWSMILSDKVERQYLSYSEAKYGEKIMLSLPIGPSSDFSEKLSSLFLPSGIVYGQNVNNLISSLTVGYHDDLNFMDLPVPFVCVAADMVTNKAKIWYEGSLNTALRSTMSIPGLFTTVRLDSLVLVDGGLRNNYPCDLAREMGADIVIGVDLNTGYSTEDEINSVLDIISVFTELPGRDAYERTREDADLTLKPELEGYTMLSFDDESIDIIIDRGYEVALRMDDELRKVKEITSMGRAHRAGDSWIGDKDIPSADGAPQRAFNINREHISLSGVEISGVNPNEEAYLIRRSGLKGVDEISGEGIMEAVNRIYGTKVFNSVTFTMRGEEEPFKLVIDCEKGPRSRVGVGLRCDSKEVLSLLFNAGFRVRRLQGAAVDLTAKLGVNPYAGVHLYHNSLRGPAVNFAARVKYIGKNMVSWNDNSFMYSYFTFTQEFWLSNMKWMGFDLGVGVRNNIYWKRSSLYDNWSDQWVQEADNVVYRDNSYLSLFFSAGADTFDNAYFPNRGFSLDFDYSWVFAGLKEDIDTFHTVQLGIKGAISFGEAFTLIPSFNARFLLCDTIEGPYINMIGGNMDGRFVDQQLDFVGLNDSRPTDNMLLLLRADFRFKLFNRNYLSAIANVGNSFGKICHFMDEEDSERFLGLGLQYGYNSPLGPLRGLIHWSSLSHSVGVYLSYGFDF